MAHEALSNFQTERLTRKEAAKYLGVSIGFLETDVITHRHRIPYFKVGRRVFYRQRDLNRWLESHAVNPTSSGPGAENTVCEAVRAAG